MPFAFSLKQHCIKKLQQVPAFVAPRQSVGHSTDLQKSGEPFPRPWSFWRTEGAEEYFWFVSPLVICWLLWSSTQWKNVSFSSEYSSVFFTPTLFYHSRPFPYAVMERSARLYWYTSLSLFHEREIIYRWKETSLLFPDTICPPFPTPTPLPTFHFYRRKRKWMSACVCV